MPNTTGLFDKIAKHYDLLNTVFSLGIDRHWRNELARETEDSCLNLDIATGTAEVALSVHEMTKKCFVIGIDPSTEMLKLAREKTAGNDRIFLVQGANEHLPFGNTTFDTVTIAFGIRNTVELERSLSEIERILKPGGKLSILEFTTPKIPVLRHLFLFYFNYVMPMIGWFFGTREEYRYLSVSSANFPQRMKFTEKIAESGFIRSSFRELTFGIVSVYTGFKRT